MNNLRKKINSKLTVYFVVLSCVIKLNESQLVCTNYEENIDMKSNDLNDLNYFVQTAYDCASLCSLFHQKCNAFTFWNVDTKENNCFPIFKNVLKQIIFFT